MSEPTIIAVQQLTITYHGREAHASGFPWLGINAADAMVVAQTAIALLRQQFLLDDRVHGFTTKGGDAANIIPAETTADYMVRAETAERLTELRSGAQLLRGRCAGDGRTLEIDEDVAYTDMRHDSEMATHLPQARGVAWAVPSTIGHRRSRPTWATSPTWCPRSTP